MNPLNNRPVWRLLNMIFNRAERAGSRRLPRYTAATMIKRCGLDENTVIDAIFAGLVKFVDKHGATQPPSLVDDLRTIYLELATKGLEWLVNTPENVVVCATGSNGGNGIVLAQLKAEVPEVNLDVLHRLHDLGIAYAAHRGTSNEIDRSSMTATLLRYPQDFTVLLTPRGREVAARVR